MGLGVEVDPDQPPDLDAQARLFPHLPDHRLLDGFAGLDAAGGQALETVVRPPCQQHPASPPASSAPATSSLPTSPAAVSA